MDERPDTDEHDDTSSEGADQRDEGSINDPLTKTDEGGAARPLRVLIGLSG